MRSTKERLAMYLGWIGFILILVGIFLPWGTYGRTPSQIRWVFGLNFADSFFSGVGCLVAIAGLLISTVKASKVSITSLGIGGLIIILAAGHFISNYYGKIYVYPTIENIWFGSLITLIGGIFEVIAAFLFAQHIGTQTQAITK